MPEEKRVIVPDKNPMPAQDPVVRVRNFDEVALGYGEDTVVAEAKRCLQCKNSPCRQGCPVEIDIPSFIRLAAQRDFAGASKNLKRRMPFPPYAAGYVPRKTSVKNFVYLEGNTIRWA